MTAHPGPRHQTVDPGPLHHVVEGPLHPPGPGAPHPPDPGVLDPSAPVPGPPIREGSPSPEQREQVVHSPPAGSGEPAVHSPPASTSTPSGSRAGPNLAGGRVVLVHGFTQTLASWGPVAERLTGRFEVVRVDLPGHGGSGDLRVGFAQAAGLVGEAGGAGAYVGYSLGGRLCLRLALDRPDLVPALVLIGGSPGIAGPGDQAERRAADEALARRIERDGVEAFLDAWLAGPLFATLPAEAPGREERLANTAEGLAYALRCLGTGVQEPLWDRLGELRPPTLLVAGELDRKFAAIAREMAAAIGPAARVALVPGAGHAAHLERPAETATLVEEFLTRSP